jgi:hypothetical protein
MMHLAKRYAPKAAIFANGSLHNVEQAVAALDDGADIVGPWRIPTYLGVCPIEASLTTSTRRSLVPSPTSREPGWRCEGNSIAGNSNGGSHGHATRDG